MLCRGAMARVRAAAGERREAVSVAQQLAAMAEGLDFATTSGMAFIDIAWVHHRIGNAAEAKRAASRAAAILDRRGAIALKRQAEAIVSEADAAAV